MQCEATLHTSCAGVVSRIEVTSYAHSSTELLGVQIDAAINSGNSGGAVHSLCRPVNWCMLPMESPDLAASCGSFSLLISRAAQAMRGSICAHIVELMAISVDIVWFR